MTKLEKILTEHIALEDSKLAALGDKIDVLQNNHIEHLKIGLAKVEKDIDWLRAILWAVFATGLVAATNAIIQIVKL